MNVSRIKSGQMGGLDGDGIDKNSQSYKDWESQGGADSGYSYNEWSDLNYQNNNQTP